MNRKKHNFIAIDLGASNGRIIIGSFLGKKLVLRSAFSFDHAICEIDGRKVWDWRAITENVVHGLYRAAEIIGDESIDSISCSGWAQDFGLLDENGELFYTPVSYHDDRTKGMPDSFSDIITADELLKRTGSAASPVTTLCQLRAMFLREPKALSHAKTLLHIPDLIHYYLCGVKSTDWTLATASQMLNLKSGVWDRELLDMFGIPHDILPPVAASTGLLGKVLGEKAPHKKLKHVPVVISANHDTAAASAALYPVKKGLLFLSSGTWSMLGCCTGDLIVPDAPAEKNLAIMGISHHQWALFRGMLGLWFIQECHRIWTRNGSTASYHELVALAESSTIESTIDPEDPRFHAPENMVSEISLACDETGQRIPQSSGDFAKVIFDSLALNYRKSIREIQDACCITFERLYIVGGGSKNDYLCRKTADILDIPIITGPAEATVIGNILLQAKALSIDISTIEMIGFTNDSGI